MIITLLPMLDNGIKSHYNTFVGFEDKGLIIIKDLFKSSLRFIDIA